MNDCVVYRLGGSAIGNDFKFFDSVKVKVKVPSTFNVSSANNIAIEPVSDAKFVDGEGNFCRDNGEIIGKETRSTVFRLPSNTDATVIFMNKSNWTQFNLTGYAKYIEFELTDLAFCTNMKNLVWYGGNTLNSAIGEVSELKRLTELEQINWQVLPEIKGDLSDFSSFKKLSRLSIIGCQGISGDVSSLTSLTELTVLNLADMLYIHGELSSMGKLVKLNNLHLNSRISGSVESLVGSFVDNGRTSGTMTFYGSTTNTFNGERIEAKNYTLTWNGKTNISLV